MMQMETNGMMVNGSGSKQPTGPDFTGKDFRGLVECYAQELDALEPGEDKPAMYMMFAGAVLRDYLRSQGQRPQQYFMLNGAVNLFRSSNLGIETLSGSNATYTLLPGSLDAAEKTILAHWTQLRRYATHDYRYYLMSLLRQPIQEAAWSQDAKIYGGRVAYIGDYIIDDHVRSSMRLYLAVCKVNLASHTFEGLTW